MKRLALLFAIVLVTLVGMIGVSRGADSGIPAVLSQLQSIQQKLDALTRAAQPKRYFITSTDTVQAGDAPNACGTGYHMASLFEILDPTQLQYDTTAPSAYTSTTDDLGSGPPTNIFGWIRTGHSSFSGADSAPGESNCDRYTTSAGGAYGTTVALNHLWEFALATFPNVNLYYLYNAPWWHPERTQCNSHAHVWCVQD
jgi:type II secretory pathway pseudopilin PulG